MRQRGRQSADDLAVNGVALPAQRLLPPDHLSRTEAKIFAEVVALSPAGHFAPADIFLLATFATLTNVTRTAAKSLAKANKETRPAIFKMLQEGAKCQAAIATKLRLTPSARIAPRTAGRHHDTHRPSAYDTMQGWDLDA